LTLGEYKAIVLVRTSFPTVLLMPNAVVLKGAGTQGERFLMHKKSAASFAIIRYNLRTYEPGGVMAIIKGRGTAEVTVRNFESGQSRADSLAGWGYFLETTDLRPGMDPLKATSVRQMRLEVRESKAQDPAMVNRLG